MYSLRKAELEDFDWMHMVAEKFTKEYGAPELYDADECQRLLTLMMQEHVLIVVCGEDNKPVGGIGGMVLPHPFNNKIKVLTELFWWVDEAHRKEKAGKMMLMKFLELGEAVADKTTVCILPSTEMRSDVLSKLGFTLMEFGYMRNH